MYWFVVDWMLVLYIHLNTNSVSALCLKNVFFPNLIGESNTEEGPYRAGLGWTITNIHIPIWTLSDLWKLTWGMGLVNTRLRDQSRCMYWMTSQPCSLNRSHHRTDDSEIKCQLFPSETCSCAKQMHFKGQCDIYLQWLNPRQNTQFCMTVHHFTSHGKTKFVTKKCAAREVCHASGCRHHRDMGHTECVSCCEGMICNVEVPTNHTNAVFAMRQQAYSSAPPQAPVRTAWGRCWMTLLTTLGLGLTRLVLLWHCCPSEHVPIKGTRLYQTSMFLWTWRMCGGNLC